MEKIKNDADDRLGEDRAREYLASHVFKNAVPKQEADDILRMEKNLPRRRRRGSLSKTPSGFWSFGD